MSFFTDKVVVVTGGTDGIGRALVTLLMQQGAKVVTCGRNYDKLYQLQTTYAGKTLLALPADVSSEADCQKLMQQAVNVYGTIDILINNAAVFGPPFQLTEDGFETQFQVNHFSNALLTLLLLPKLESSSSLSHKSRVIMITSTLYKKGIINENHFKKGYFFTDC